MDSVFLLWHVREVEHNESELLIGVYSTELEAIAAIERVRDRPGFVNYPGGFQIHSHELNRDGWTEGFISTTDAK
jgi:homoserine kinase type II